jgi:hypothetical protein
VLTSGAFGDGKYLLPIGLRMHMTWPLRAASHMGIGLVSEGNRRDGSGPRQAGPTGAELFGLSAFIALCVLIPLVAGLLIDNVAHTSPLGLLVGLAIGIVAAGAGTMSRLRRYL